MTLHRERSFNPTQGDTREKEISRRQFLKTLGACVAVAALEQLPVSLEAKGEREKGKVVIDTYINEARILLHEEDIAYVKENNDQFIDYQKRLIEYSFDQNPSLQEDIFKNEKMRDMTTMGLLRARELGFEINITDTYHAHLIIDKQKERELKKLVENYKQEGNAQNLPAIINFTEGLLFHAAEWPDPILFQEEQFRQRYPKRNILIVDDKVIDIPPQANERNTFRYKDTGGILPTFTLWIDDINRFFKERGIKKEFVDANLMLKFKPKDSKRKGITLTPQLSELIFTIPPE